MRAILALALLVGCGPYAPPPPEMKAPPNAEAFCRYRATVAGGQPGRLSDQVLAEMGAFQACMRYVRETGELPR